MPDANKAADRLILTITIILGCQVLLGLFSFFVHCFEGWTFNSDYWITNGPKIHYRVALTNYIFAPLLVFGLFWLYLDTSGSYILSAIFMFFNITAIANIVVFLITVNSWFYQVFVFADKIKMLRAYNSIPPAAEFKDRCPICLGGKSNAQNRDSELKRIR